MSVPNPKSAYNCTNPANGKTQNHGMKGAAQAGTVTDHLGSTRYVSMDLKRKQQGSRQRLDDARLHYQKAMELAQKFEDRPFLFELSRLNFWGAAVVVWRKLHGLKGAELQKNIMQKIHDDYSRLEDEHRADTDRLRDYFAGRRGEARADLKKLEETYRVRERQLMDRLEVLEKELEALL